MYLQSITRDVELVHTLMRYPATSEMIHRASEAWANPLGSRSRTKVLLKRLFDRHYISRQEIPTPGRGNNPMLYYLSPRASELCPELEELAARVRKGKRCPLFRGLSESPHHTLAASSFCAELERSAGHTRGRAKILRTLRPREFTAEVAIRTKLGEDRTKLIPDYTHVIAVDGRPRLFFTEIQHRCPLIIPLSPQSVSRSFQHKLTRYKVFSKTMRNHPLIKQLEHDLGCAFDRFTVLVATTRGQDHLQNLMAANRGRDFDQMFLFARLEIIEAEGANMFMQPLWTFSSGKSAKILRV